LALTLVHVRSSEGGVWKNLREEEEGMPTTGE